MSTPEKRTYTPWQQFGFTSRQKEYREPTRMLDADGTLLAAGWGRHNVFDYDRSLVRPKMRGKEWDFYQISDGKYMAQLNFANISIAGYIAATLVDLHNGRIVASAASYFALGRDKYPLPAKGDVPNRLGYKIGKAEFSFVTTDTGRTLDFTMNDVECHFSMDIRPNQENITTILPFKDKPTRYFMTTKQNGMPCQGSFKSGAKEYVFNKDETFAVLDWGRVNTPRRLVWYWGNGSTWLTGADGVKHCFGFEITWGIGDESNATETCLFYDGKAHKIGAIDVEVFPKPDKYMEPWHFVSEDGRFDMTMKPFYDHFSDTNMLIVRMLSHQVHGLWSGTAILDDGTKLEIKDMYAFCEYVENKW